MQILKSENYRRMPWKNGGGETAEIAIFPPDAALNAFDWRISMATVDADGPFSTFEDVDRTLTILSGAGMILTIGDQPEVTLTRGSAPLPFHADVAAGAVLVDGPVIDLNVMTQRKRLSHTVHRLSLPLDLPPSRSTRAVFCPEGNLKLAWADGAETLQTWDCVLIDAGDPAVSLEGCPSVILIEIDARD
ncbi:environmental stress-induced protein Ves [Neorhizobium galegae]|uniref:HutD/Ves family protein n=1 Tax=Neorhizobium galegae TaxID=399 RepID=UPI001AE6BE5B|nr:HutD family protein [Neorhizobium galegae]MBP2551482.1 environmental stress-induced protein Ves [Neorhizobium galegae]